MDKNKKIRIDYTTGTKNFRVVAKMKMADQIQKLLKKSLPSDLTEKDVLAVKITLSGKTYAVLLNEAGITNRISASPEFDAVCETLNKHPALRNAGKEINRKKLARVALAALIDEDSDNAFATSELLFNTIKHKMLPEIISSQIPRISKIIVSELKNNRVEINPFVLQSKAN